MTEQDQNEIVWRLRIAAKSEAEVHGVDPEDLIYTEAADRIIILEAMVTRLEETLRNVVDTTKHHANEISIMALTPIVCKKPTQ